MSIIICPVCNVFIPYEPFKCIQCDQDVCLNCITNTDVMLCLSCHNEQKALITEDKMKCMKCEKVWIPKNLNCTCTRKTTIVHCDDCSIKCTECDQRICRFCNTFCVKHGIQCSLCYAMKRKCDLKACKMCVAKYCRSHNAAWPIIDKASHICRNHVCKCIVCKSAYCVYQTPCQRKKCITSSTCTSCWFKDKDQQYTIHVCHDHTMTCGICKKFAPKLRDRNVKFIQKQNVIETCSNCYDRILWITHILYQKLPKELVEKIVLLSHNF